ncbi:hypothetical protein DFP78_11233 [Photobacterium lutimaris]|nr:hypothetical protein DFP78_11233 [Photobacterium lutimaris]
MERAGAQLTWVELEIVSLRPMKQDQIKMESLALHFY